MQATTTAGKWLLDKKDFLKGLAVAVISAVVTTLYSAIQTGGFSTINWNEVGTVAALAAGSYLIKNFLSPTQIVINNPTKKAVETVKKEENHTVEINSN